MQSNRRLLFVPCSAILLVAVAVCWPTATVQPGRPDAALGAEVVAADNGAAATLRRAAATARATGYTAMPGTRLHYELQLQTGASMGGAQANANAAPPQPIEIGVAGEWQVHVLDRRADEMLVHCCLAAARISTAGEPAATTREQSDVLARALGRGFDLRLDVAGRPLAIRFRGEWNAEQRHFARALVGTFHSEYLPRDEWRSDVDDAMGKHSFAWRSAASDDAVDGVDVRRERTGFAPRHDEADGSADVQASGTALSHFAHAVGWLTAIEVDDAVAWTCIGGTLRLATQQHGTLRWLRSEVAAATPVWDGDFAAIDGSAELQPVAGDPLRAHWREQLRGRDAKALLAELRALLALSDEPCQQRHELLQLIAEVVRNDSAQADMLAAAVQSARLTGQPAADVLSALGTAGTERAQAALGAVFANGLVGPALRQAAAESMFQIEQPTPDLVDQLRRTLHGSATFDALGGSTMLVLGAFASRGARSADGQPVVADLLALESAVRSQGVEPGWFEALGNTGDPAVLPLAASLCASADATERAWGLTALRRVDAATAHDLQRAAARGDTAAPVRRQAIEQIAASTAPWATAALVERVDTDDDVDVRQAAYAGLMVRARTDERARAALRRRVATETDAGLAEQLRTWARGS
jgi:hypothetical protein